MIPTLRCRLRTALLLAVLALPAAFPATAFAAAPQAAAAKPAATTDPAAADLPARLDALFRAAYPADEPGATVLVRRGDEVLLRAGYGMADLEMGVPMAPEMVLRIGSITKQFTAAAVLLLAAEGRLDLAAPISHYLPDFTGPGAAVTVEQLMTHVSGIPSYTSQPGFLDRSRHDVTPEERIAELRDLPLDFPTGTEWSYNNSAYFLLGALIEKVSGTSWAQFLEARIFEPLGLEHTTYGDTLRIIPGRVEGYHRPDPDGDYVNALFLSMTQPYAAGALVSTVDDLSRWTRALAGDELLPRAWRERLWTTARLADGRATNYGFGFQISDYAGHRVIHHNGGINGFVSDALWVPDEDLYVVVLSNNTGKGVGGPSTQAMALALGKPMDERPRIELPPAALDEYVGVYEVNGDAEDLRVVTRDGGQLFTQRTGGSKLPIHFSAADRFYYSDALAHGRFLRDASGRVTGMELTPSTGPDDTSVKTARPLPQPPRKAEVDPAVLDGLVGRYEIHPGFVLEISREGDALYAQATGQPRFQVFPESEQRWFLEVVDAVIEFQRGEDGAADSLVLHQGGQEIPAQRID
ncbi:MAG TPA: serine hydrolase [Thermoanaerobaculia bacterium]|nr:serine hydrolase [Thermoanaerobaculia bacterium]